MEKLMFNQLEIERQKINQIDRALVGLIDKRFEVVRTISELKKELNLTVFQPKRELEILKKVSELSENPNSIVKIFKLIMYEAKVIQTR